MSKLIIMVSIYESGQWIENRLNNLMESTYPDKEIWCINANSPDERDDIIPRRYPVKYIKLEQRINVYAAWNYIIKESQGTYITNANTDDIVSPYCYQKLIAALESDPKCGFAYPSWYCTTIPNQQWNSITHADPGGRPGRFCGDITTGGVGHFPLWRKSLHDKLGYFDDSFGALADADWWTRCWVLGRTQFLWVDELLGLYLWRNGQNLWHRAISPAEWERYFTKYHAYRSQAQC